VTTSYITVLTLLVSTSDISPVIAANSYDICQKVFLVVEYLLYA